MSKSRGSTLIFLFIVLALFFSAAVGRAEGKKYYKRTMEEYNIPDVVLLNQEGEKVKIKAYLDGEKPVIVNFIYGTCTTICPVLSAGFAHFQKKLGQEAGNVQLVSISIDPDNDTPELMREHLQRYEARPGWDVFTGKRAEIIKVLREFDAYVANKMNHYPLTILRAPGDKKWVRLNGLLSTAELKGEYQQLVRQ